MPHSYPHHRMHGQVVHDLGSRIVRGDIPVGATLPTEEQLVAELGLSRPALREALKVLAGKGLVASRPRAGTQVQPESRWALMDPDVLGWRYVGDPTPKQLEDLAGLRVALEPEAARLAASSASTDDVARIRAAYDRMVETLTDPDAFIAADLAFHEAVFDASGNDLLVHLHSMTSVALAAVRQVHTRSTRRNRQTLPVHEQVLLAVEAGVPDDAARVMRELVENARNDVRSATTRRRRTAG